MSVIRDCDADDIPDILSIINAGAERYRHVIPAEHWRDPYMSKSALERELAAGVRFQGYEEEDSLVGVMGIQEKDDVDLIRHAYVRPDFQGRGVGSNLLRHLTERSRRTILIGTWAAASWAINFYRKNGFELTDPEAARDLLDRYWDVPEDQMRVSVVLRGAPAAG